MNSQSKSQYTDQQLRSFLDKGLAPELMSQIEVQLRTDRELCSRVIGLAGERDAGIHSLGDIWRKHRLSCPTRQQLGGYLLGALDQEWMEYIRFHIEQIECRVCMANALDLATEQQIQADSEAARTSQASRRRKYFQSSAGYFNRP